MLILQRKAGEAIRIGEDITIRISEIGAERVKIAIDAPKGLPIMREELLTAAQTNKQSAAAMDLKTLTTIQQMLHPKKEEEK